MMWRRLQKRENTTEENEKALDEVKSFHEMFKIVSFAMSAGVLYPNPLTDRFRISVVLFVYASVAPITAMVFIDVYSSWLRKDIQNIIRHGTIIIPFLLVLIKMYLMYHNRVEARKIIDEISRDNINCNLLPNTYNSIIKEHLKITLFGEKYWLFICTLCVLIFPFMSTASNLFNFTFSSEPKKYMVHDLNVPFMEPDVRFETPYFEVMYAYMMYCCVIYFLNFMGYDGFFGVAINHACFKMKLYCKALEDALKQSNEEEMFEELVRVIQDQCRAYRFVDTIQKTFNFWLGMIFTVSVVHVCNCMYQIMEGLGLDLKYLIFIAGSVIHIYLPCSYASQLKRMSTDTSTLIYCSGWERINNQRVRKTLTFMIARAQIPAAITAFNMLTFDMELFVSILHTAYSMFTLLKRKG